MNSKKCSHVEDIKDVKTALAYECEECVKSGDSWVHLRICQTCGVTLCCDSSPNRHATKHFRHSEHPVITSAEPNERWMWCYVHEKISKY